MTLIRPLQLMLTEPIVLSLNVYIALIYSILYVWFESFPLVFEGVYGFSLGIEGVAYVGILVGAVVTYACHCVYAKLVMERLFEPDERGCVRMIPEDRLPPAFIGCWCIPICMFFFGWTSTASIHWIVPIIGSSFFPAGSFLLFQSVINYLPDCNPDYYPGCGQWTLPCHGRRRIPVVRKSNVRESAEEKRAHGISGIMGMYASWVLVPCHGAASVHIS